MYLPLHLPHCGWGMRRVFLCFLAGLMVLTGAAWAQVPAIINYQGQVAVNGSAFEGSGQFKFALVDGAGTTTYWSHNGTSVNGAEPTGPAVTLSISRGLFSVALGDTGISGMSQPLSPSLFANSAVFLRVWFNDGTTGWQRLDPDQRIAAVGYAMVASTVADGAITSAKLADGAVTSPKIAAGAVTGPNVAAGAISGTQLAPGAALANLNANRQTGVPGDSLILSENPDSSALTGNGYIRIGQVQSADSWVERSSGPVPVARDLHTAVWTGSEMIVWGGGNDSCGPYCAQSDGARYVPAIDAWRAMSSTDAPVGRVGHTAVWTGTEMIVWGGAHGQITAFYNTGGRYNPTTDTWTATTTTGAPGARDSHTAVWTGSRMIVWGGMDNPSTGHTLNSGGCYDPATDSWTPTSTQSAPSARHRHTAVWTGQQMLIWGGYYDAFQGGRYDPATDTWTSITMTGAPNPRASHAAVWTGQEMLVWGGTLSTQSYRDGGRYNPTTDSWGAITATGAPANSYAPRAAWTGSEMIVWGGFNFDQNTTLACGGRYNPASGQWASTSSLKAPEARVDHSAVWTGEELIVWGGRTSWSPNTQLQTGGRYNPSLDSWRATTIDTPGKRTGFSTVWTGSELLVWGGLSDLCKNQYGEVIGVCQTGMRFDPALNSWRIMGGTPPDAAYGHSAVWTGTEMLVWGGSKLEWVSAETGGRYNPVTDQWTAISTVGAPLWRRNHFAFWTGQQMIVWGGGTGGEEWQEGLPFSYLNHGGRYDPLTDTWQAISTYAAPQAYEGQSAVWTGTKMIVWGGQWTDDNDVTYYVPYGGTYDPVTDEWGDTDSNCPPPGRAHHSAVWTGTDMLIWGGVGATGLRQNGLRYRPVQSPCSSWTEFLGANVPAARKQHTAVWTGTEMLVWGGTDGNNSLNTGGRYNPVLGSWTATSVNPTPAARIGHTLVWTGKEALLLGGTGTGGALSDLYSYAPPRPLYLYQKLR